MAPSLSSPLWRPQEMPPGDQGLLSSCLAALQNPPQHGAPGSLPAGSVEDCEPVICPGFGLTPLTAEKVKILLKENGLQVGSPTMLPDMASAGNRENLNCFMETKKVLLNPFNTGGTGLRQCNLGASPTVMNFQGSWV